MTRKWRPLTLGMKGSDAIKEVTRLTKKYGRKNIKGGPLEFKAQEDITARGKITWSTWFR